MKKRERTFSPVNEEIEHLIYSFLLSRDTLPFPRGAGRAYPLLAATCAALRRAGVAYTVKRRKRSIGSRFGYLQFIVSRQELEKKVDMVIAAIENSLSVYYHVKKLNLQNIAVSLVDGYRKYHDARVTTAVKQMRRTGTINPYTAVYLATACTRLGVEHAIKYQPDGSTVMLADFAELNYIPSDVKKHALNETRKAMWLTFCCEKITVAPLRIEIT